MRVATMNLPLVIELENACFNRLRQIQSLTMNNLERIDSWNFHLLLKLTQIKLPKLKVMMDCNFWGLDSLIHLELNELEVIETYNFHELPNLQTVKMDRLKDKGYGNFKWCNGMNALSSIQNNFK